MLRATPTTNEQQELALLNFIITQINMFSDREEVAKISKNLSAILKNKPKQIGSLRTKISDIYRKEKTHGSNYSPLFYDALFSLSILLAKYHPHNDLDEEGNLVCPITCDSIAPESRLFTSQGTLYDRAALNSNIEQQIATARQLNQVPKLTNPVDALPFSERELLYLYSRIQAPNNDNELPSIPHPKEIKEMAEMKAAPTCSENFWRFMSFMIRNQRGALIGTIPSALMGEAASSLAFVQLIPDDYSILDSILILLSMAFGGVIVCGLPGAVLGAALQDRCQRAPAPIRVPRIPEEEKPVLDLESCADLLSRLQTPEPLLDVHEEKAGQELALTMPVANIEDDAPVIIPVEKAESSADNAPASSIFHLFPTNSLRQPLLASPHPKPNNAFLSQVETTAKNYLSLKPS